MTELRDRAGTFGIWTGSFQWPDDPGAVADAAAELEALGFGTLWVGLSEGDLALHETILEATSELVVASGIVNVWTEPVQTVAARTRRLVDRFPGRFVLGIGAGHARHVEAATGQSYVRPLSKVAAYLDELDRADVPERVLAALGPRALALAGERAAGAHPYLVPVEHTADARSALGRDPFLAPEQKVVLEPDPETARATARRVLAGYLELPNYLNNLRRYGFGDPDFADGGSDGLVDRVVAWGDDGTAEAAVRGHLDAGADHVALQVLAPGEDTGLPRAAWRAAADVLVR